MARRLGRKWAGDSLEFGERFFMKEAKERASGAVKRDWEPEAHRSQVSWTARTDGCRDGYHCRRSCSWKAWTSIARNRALGSNRLARSQRSTLKSILRPNQGQPRQNEENEGDQNLSGPETQLEGVREKRAQFDEASSAPASGADANEDDGIQSKRTRGKDTRGREFHVTKKDVERFGPTAGCPACANATKGVSGRHAHNDECRDRIGKLLMDEGAQRIESYFERARVREETCSGGAATSSGFETDTTDSQTPKRKGDDETNEMDERSKKRQTTGVIGTPVPTVHVGGSSGSGGHGHRVSITTTEQRIVVPPEVPQDTRRCIEDMEISQLEMKNEVREVQGVSLDADKRELQRLARDSADYYFRDKQVEASDALIDEVGALLTESGGAQIIETVALDRFAAKVGDLRLRPCFAIDLCENKPYGQHEDECWDLSKNSDVKELFEISLLNDQRSWQDHHLVQRFPNFEM